MPFGENDPIVAPPPQEKEKPGFWKSLATGGIQGATLGFADELAGAYEKLLGSKGVQLGAGADFSKDDTPEVRAAKEELLRRNMTAPTPYEATRDSLRQGAHDAEEAHPWAFGLGQAAGGLALPVPGGAAKGATWMARLGKTTATGAGLGTLAGIGASEADSAGGVAQDALKSGAIGAGGGLLAGLAGEAVGALNGRAQRGVEKARADNLEKTQAARTKAAQSKMGEYRSEVQSAHRDLEVLEKAAQGNDEEAWLASQFLESPEAERLRKLVARGKLESGPQRVANAGRLRELAVEAQQAASPEAVAVAAEENLQNPLTKEVLPRLKTYATRSIGPAIGGFFGGPGGMAAGTMVSNVIGRPGTAMANMSRAPSVRNALWGAIEAATAGAPEAGKLARPMATPLRSAGARLLEMVNPASKVRAVAETLGHPDDEVVSGY